MTNTLIQIRFTAGELQALLDLVQYDLDCRDAKDGAPLLPIATKLLDAQADLEHAKAAKVDQTLYPAYGPDGQLRFVSIPDNEDK